MVETVHFFITPKAPASASDTVQRGVLFYFSRSEGICESDDYGAMPVVYTLRPDKSLQHVRLQGLYPCGEGAGYAGGIVSAAVDGERCAEAAAGKTEA